MSIKRMQPDTAEPRYMDSPYCQAKPVCDSWYKTATLHSVYCMGCS